MKKPETKSILIFAGGAVAAWAAAGLGKSKALHKATVKTVASGMKVKDTLVRKAEAIREEAQDIYEEARRLPEESLEEI